MVSRSYLASQSFWAGSLERAVKTFAQTLIAALGVGTGAPVIGVNLIAPGVGTLWLTALSFAASASLLSLLMSIASGASGVGPTGSPSLVNDRPSTAELADAKAGRHHRDDGIDVALDDPEVPR